MSQRTGESHQRENQKPQESGSRQAAYDMIYLAGCGVNKVISDRERIEKMDLKAVREISNSLSLNVLVYLAVESAYDGTLPKTAFFKEWEEEKDHVLYQSLKTDVELQRLTDFLEENGISYTLLKGIVLKNFYPEPEMRQMCDIDILFDPNCRNQVRQWFLSHDYKIKRYNVGVEDVYQKEPFYHFEMHTDLLDRSFEPTLVSYCKNLKGHLLPSQNSCSFYFSDEDLYLYFFIHMYKHYYRGGTGLRSLLDLYVYLMAKEKDLSWDYIRQELSKAGLTEFEEKAVSLCKKLFSEPATFEVSVLTEEEISFLDEFLFYGTYGTVEHDIHQGMKRMGYGEEGQPSVWTKFRYIWKRAFPPADAIVQLYPFLERHKCLLPAGYVYRIISRGIRSYRTRIDLRDLRKM